MPFDVTRKTVGFEPAGSMIGFPSNPVPYVLKPDEEFTKGDMVKFEYGKVTKADSSDTDGILGVMAESVKQEDNPKEKRTKALVYDDPHRVYRVTFETKDDNEFEATGGASDGSTVIASSGPGNDNTFRGGLLYVYEGTNKGCVRTVKEFAESTNTFTVEKPFPKECDDTTKFIVLGDNSAADRPINVGTKAKLEDEAKVDSNADPSDGPLFVREIYPEELMMDVVVGMSSHVIN